MVLAGFGALSIGSLAAAGTAVGLHPAFYGALLGGAAHLGWQLSTVNLGSPADCLRKFQSNHQFGLLIFLGIVAGKLLLPQEEEDESREVQPRLIDMLRVQLDQP